MKRYLFLLPIAAVLVLGVLGRHALQGVLLSNEGREAPSEVNKQAGLAVSDAPKTGTAQEATPEQAVVSAPDVQAAAAPPEPPAMLAPDAEAAVTPPEPPATPTPDVEAAATPPEPPAMPAPDVEAAVTRPEPPIAPAPDAEAAATPAPDVQAAAAPPEPPATPTPDAEAAVTRPEPPATPTPDVEAAVTPPEPPATLAPDAEAAVTPPEPPATPTPDAEAAVTPPEPPATPAPDAEAAAATPGPPSPEGDAAAPAESVTSEPPDVTTELAALRAEVKLLQQSVDVYLGSLLSDLQSENERLREELRQIQSSVRAPGVSIQDMPPPYPEPAYVTAPIEGEDSYADAVDQENLEAIRKQDEALLKEALDKDFAVGDLTYTVISEWGRSPDEAAKLGEGTASLKGMVCAVPPGYSEGTLLALGRKLRTTFAEYDNLNIEVLDDVGAAKLYAEKNVDPFERRVLSVSKHRRSGRDVILLYENGAVREVPWTE